MNCSCDEKKEIKIYLFPDGKMPEYKTEGAACLDCCARLAVDSLKIPKDSRCLVNLGFALELPIGYEAQIRPRSGMSKIGIDVALGTVDWDYRSEVKACVINNTDGDYLINNGDRICQMTIKKVDKFPFVKVDDISNLSKTERGEGGFGSTGIK